jgi:hypothetical protein
LLLQGIYLTILRILVPFELQRGIFEVLVFCLSSMELTL